MKRRWQLLVPMPLLALAVALIIWRGPNWKVVHDAFSAVTWEWVAAAIGLNLLSVLARAFAWDTAIKQSIEPPHPRFPLVFSASRSGCSRTPCCRAALASSRASRCCAGG